MRYEFANVASITPGLWRWTHVDPRSEWADRLTGQIVIETDFLDRFERLRAALGFALPINSGYRTPEHNQIVSTTGADGPHTTGRACDIAIYGAQALQLIPAAVALGFTGFGIEQKQTTPVTARYIHVDDLGVPYPRPMLWSY
jgi:uncharacterized protein YcbK (DUF882 family)